MAGKKHNKKLPKDAISEQDIDPKYGYVHGEWNALGGHHMSYLNPAEYEKFYHEVLHASGSYNTKQQDSDKKEIATTLGVGESRKYTGGGHSHQCDGHMDTTGEGTGRMEFPGDFAMATAKDYLLGVAGKAIKVMQDEMNANPKGSAATQSVCLNNRRQSITGNDWKHVEKDSCEAVEGYKMNIFNKDLSNFIKANMDTMVKEKGKLEVQGAYSHVSGNTLTVTSKKATSHSSDDTYSTSAKKNMTHSSDQTLTINGKEEVVITSDTKITLKVGSNKIEISSSGITINAGSGKLDLKASGDVTTQGSTTKLQGGGSPGIPTTIT
jgi:hypothetical protein